MFEMVNIFSIAETKTQDTMTTMCAHASNGLNLFKEPIEHSLLPPNDVWFSRCCITLKQSFPPHNELFIWISQYIITVATAGPHAKRISHISFTFTMLSFHAKNDNPKSGKRAILHNGLDNEPIPS